MRILTELYYYENQICSNLVWLLHPKTVKYIQICKWGPIIYLMAGLLYYLAPGNSVGVYMSKPGHMSG